MRGRIAAPRRGFRPICPFCAVIIVVDSGFVVVLVHPRTLDQPRSPDPPQNRSPPPPGVALVASCDGCGDEAAGWRGRSHASRRFDDRPAARPDRCTVGVVPSGGAGGTGLVPWRVPGMGRVCQRPPPDTGGKAVRAGNAAAYAKLYQTFWVNLDS